MALVLADRVKETTTSTGTTAITLAVAATGYQTFLLAVGNANTTYYTIADQTGANWEVGIGTYTTIGNTLSRDTVLASSNAGALVVFLTGTKDVFVTYPAERALYTGGPLGTPASGTLTNATGLPISSGVSGLGTGVSTFLETPTSSNLLTAVTDETGTGSLVFGTTPTFIGLRETKIVVAASDIDLSLGNFFTKTISGTTTLTVSNIPATGIAGEFILDITNGGSAAVTWWSGIKWANGIVPSLSVAGRDSIGFYTYDGGTTWTGVFGKDFR